MTTGRRMVAACTAVLALSLALPAFAQNDKNQDEKDEEDVAPKAAKMQHAVLGVLVEDLHPAFSAQLPDVVAPEQGVLIEGVGDHSPASRAGLKLHDILVTYDDQKIFSAEQLFKLIRADKPGRDVTLGIVRNGKLETKLVQLGEHHEPAMRTPMAGPPSGPGQRRGFRWGWPFAGPRRAHPGWNNFDSMSLKKLDNNRFHASIEHTDKNGKLKKHEFEGTAEEIHAQIQKDPDMTPAERMHLMHSLDLGVLPEPILILPESEEILELERDLGF